MEDGEEAAAGRLSTETVAERRARLGADREVTRSGFARRLILAITIVVGIVLLFVGITGVTGLPGPEPIRRYPLADLQRVADDINRSSAAPLNAGGPRPSPAVDRAPASVNVLRGRIQIEGRIPCGIGLESVGEWEMLLPGYTIESSGCEF